MNEGNLRMTNFEQNQIGAYFFIIVTNYLERKKQPFSKRP